MGVPKEDGTTREEEEEGEGHKGWGPVGDGTTDRDMYSNGKDLKYIHFTVSCMKKQRTDGRESW